MTTTEQRAPRQIMLYGPQGHGKTWMAWSVSKYWPKKFPTDKPVVLKDVLSIEIDNISTDGFAEAGLKAPHVVSIPWLLTRKGKCKTILDAMERAKELVEEKLDAHPEIEYIIGGDSISVLDTKIGSYWERNPPKSKSGKVDGWELSAIKLMTHEDWVSWIGWLGLDVIWVCHSKRNIKEGEQASRASDARLPPGYEDIVPQISGRAWELYTAPCSLWGVVKAKERPNGLGFMRTFLPTGGDGFAGKNRVQLSLGKEEPANLREIMTKCKWL